MFVASLRQKTSRRIIQGDALRNESTDIMGGGNIAPKEAGLSAAKSAGAGILVLGKVTSHKTESMLNFRTHQRELDHSEHRHGVDDPKRPHHAHGS